VSDYLEAFQRRLRGLRAERDLTQEQLGELVHVDRQTISNWESGQNTPSLANAVAIAKVFGVTTDYLVGRGV
jgi:DNA-binding XRE family transcriptional regulator